MVLDAVQPSPPESRAAMHMFAKKKAGNLYNVYILNRPTYKYFFQFYLVLEVQNHCTVKFLIVAAALARKEIINSTCGFY